jgi:hypothetical protein
MWPWIKRWRDWAMNDLWPINRIGGHSQAMHFSYEKAGLTIENQPIPWNADAVVVECLLRGSSSSRRREDYLLRLPEQEPLLAETLRRDDSENCCRLFFRLPAPQQTITAELLWRTHVLGRLTLPVLPRAEFVQQLCLQMPSLAVCLGEQTVACQTFVSTQCRGLIASALLVSPTALAPILDLGLRVEFQSGPGVAPLSVPVQFSSSQLRGKQALVTVALQRFPRRIAAWQATWLLDDRMLAAQQVRAISKQRFQHSLRVSETRFVVQSAKGEITLARQLPALDGAGRVGPCFFISSSEPGMAGLCRLQIRAQVPGGVQPPLLQEQDVLITDGPSPFAPGTLDVADLAQMSGFELSLKTRALGVLPLSPAPAASFTTEGGFKPPPEFTWSTAADDELNERLTRLLDARSK